MARRSRKQIECLREARAGDRGLPEWKAHHVGRSSKPGRNGVQGLAQRIEMHSPLSVVILMLGTNDFQFSHPDNTARSAAQGVAALINEIRGAPIEPGMPVPPVLVVCPPPIVSPKGAIVAKFAGAEQRCVGLADAFREVSSRLGCHFFDARSVTPRAGLTAFISMRTSIYYWEARSPRQSRLSCVPTAPNSHPS